MVSGIRLPAGGKSECPAMLWYMHRENIMRLQAGTEGKIGDKK